jgi:hypothetical protein
MLSLGLLGRHVRRRSHEGAGIRERVLAGHARDAEVGDLRATLFVEDDVRRLQVAVDQATVVRVCEARRDVCGDALALRVVEWLPGSKPVFERAAGEVLEHHVRTALRAPVVVDPADVRVRERSDRLSFSLEPLGIGVGSEQLQCDVSVELRVVRKPDLCHPAGSELLLETVSASDRLAHPQ